MKGHADDRRFWVTLMPSGLRYEAPAASSLLEAGLAAGIRMPKSCRNGTCRACMCRIASGEVVYRIEWPGLSSEEKKEGWTLPCVAHPASNVTLEMPGA